MSEWLGSHKIPMDSAWFWQLGPLLLHVDNRISEWRVVGQPGRDHTLATLASGPVAPDEVPQGGLVARFASRHDENTIALGAALADRPVVVRPETPVWLLGGEQVHFFLSTPLWITVTTAETGRLLTELPTFRPSDTWFGTSTRTGELAYASRSRAQREPSGHPFRATTRLLVINHEADPLRIERIKLPVPSLSLYQDEAGGFWTSVVVMEGAEGGTVGHLRIVDHPPEEAKNPRLVAGPRVAFQEQLGLVKALTALWA
jgi:hypothetical protein